MTEIKIPVVTDFGAGHFGNFNKWSFWTEERDMSSENYSILHNLTSLIIKLHLSKFVSIPHMQSFLSGGFSAMKVFIKLWVC